MRQKLISSGLFIVMMIVVLHNAIPHHHHNDLLMHYHGVPLDDQNDHSACNHQPVSCQIQTIDFNVPRALNVIKIEVTNDVTNLFGISVTTLHFPNAELCLSFVPIPPGDPLVHGIITDLPARAPPC